MIIKKSIYWTVKGIDVFMMKHTKGWVVFYWDNLFDKRIILYNKKYFIGGYSKLKSFENRR